MLKLNKVYSRYFFSQSVPIDNKLYGIANRMGGSSHDGLYEIYAGKFKNPAIEEFKSRYKAYKKFKDPLKKYNTS